MSPIRVEVAYALPERQMVRQVVLPAGGNVAAALQSSGLLEEFPEIDLAVNRIGIYGTLARLDTELRDGDRVEILRPLLVDPKELRRGRAKLKPRSVR